MSDIAFENFTQQIQSLSYEQTLLLMEKLLESLKTKKNEEDYFQLENDIAQNTMNTIWQELENDTW